MVGDDGGHAGHGALGFEAPPRLTLRQALQSTAPKGRRQDWMIDMMME